MAQDSTVVGDLEAARKTRLQNALKRVTTDRDVANARLFVASDALHQNTGVDLPVDGGRTMLRVRRDSRERIGEWTLEIIRRSDAAQGFEVLPRRWVVHGEFVNYAAIGIWNRPRQCFRQA